LALSSKQQQAAASRKTKATVLRQQVDKEAQQADVEW
jgi:hypothetical protein